MKRREVLCLGVALALPAKADAAELPLSPSLATDLAAALAARRALVVMVSLDHCPYCRFVRDNHLVHLRAAGQPVVQVDTGSSRALTDVQGQATTHDQQVRAWRVRVAPTLLFLGAGGKEVAPRLVGAAIPDFYGAYLDERVALANSRIA
jgi:thioredoxin-related protein